MILSLNPAICLYKSPDLLINNSSQSGTYHVEASNEKCPNKSNSVSVNFIVPRITLSSSASLIPAGESVTIDAETNLTNMTWFSGNNILVSNTTSKTQEIFPKQVSTIYKVDGTYRGCFASASIVIKTVPLFTAPYLFTPNGDGDNDDWVVENLTLYSSYTVDIYNRWGNKIRSYGNEFTSWDGKNRQGNSVPIGTYYYVIKASIETKEVSLSGYMTVSE